MGEEKEAAPAPVDPPKEGAEEQTEPKAGEEEPEVEEELNPVIDLTNHFIKPDHFDGIHVLEDALEKIDGAPNFRNIPGFPVYGTGQPTEKAFEEIINKLGKEENEKVIWINLRREPIVYINGSPYAVRQSDNLHENIKTQTNDEEAKVLGKHLVRVVTQRAAESADKSIKVHTDKEYNDNPMDRVDQEETVVVESVKDLDTIYQSITENCKVDLRVFRVPLIEDQMPDEECFDSIINILKDEPASVPVIFRSVLSSISGDFLNCLAGPHPSPPVFSCQMGKGRTSLGISVALLIKEIQLTTQLR